MLSLALVLFGCQQAEIMDPNEMGGPKMKTVTISVGIDDLDTKASLDSETGKFAWQSGDMLSVLATDGNFYDFALTASLSDRTAEFEGSIPETASATTVATYPRIVENGTANTVLTENTLNYVIPSEWTYVEGVSNVPMVATFGDASELMHFKQVGGVMRFPVKNLPPEAVFVLTMNDKTVTGPFPVDITNLGETYMVAGTEPSVVTINYSADVDGADAEFNVPVPVGTYNNFKVEIKDAAGTVLLSKDYTAENTVNRATLLNMSELVLSERAMEIEAWPFFVDARVLFAKYDGVTKYAFYIDGATEPVILEAEDFEDRAAVLIGGEFEHNSTHTVAVAKVVDGVPVAESMSKTVSFTTGRVMQMTYNTGTKFVCAGWDDVAIGTENSTVYDEATMKWSMVPKDDAVNGRNLRGYRVQLYAEDKETLLYDEVPFSGQVDYGGAFSSSSWVGKIGGQNVLLPTALTFGWLEPGKKYYFRVQTLAQPATFDSVENGYFDSGEGVTVSSTRGGCGWSEMVEMTTDSPHIPTSNEVLFEGFDDMMFNSDMMNMCSAAVPQILTTTTTAGNYKSRKSADLYKTWVAQPFEQRKFSEQGFNTMLGAYYHGLTDIKRVDSETARYLNEYAGSLEGWYIKGAGNDKRTMNPNFGSVRMGESSTASGYVQLRTAPIMSDKLSETVPTKCIVRVKVSANGAVDEEKGKTNVNRVLGVFLYRPNADGTISTIDNKNTIDISLNDDGVEKPEWTENYVFTDYNNYIHYPTWFEVTAELDLYKGDIVAFEKSNPKINGASDYYHGCITIGEISIEVAPDKSTFVDNGVGTEPNDKNYDVFGLGEFPISYWYTVEPGFYHTDGVYDHEKAVARYKEVREAGFNVEIYWGHHTPTDIESNKRIHDICADLGMKFIGNVHAADGTSASRIQLIKENFGNSTTYVGELYGDEPSVQKFDECAAFVNEYNAALTNKEVYINLFPEYADAAKQLKTDYENYINTYLDKVHTKSLSYDFYGLRANGDLYSCFFSNLDMVRSKTLALGMPFWVITQACQTPSCRYPNEYEQRWSVWATIAGGSKGISYFCYGTPTGSTWESLLDLNGNKTQMYNWVKKINADINTVGKKLIHCHADGAILTATKYYPLYDNAGAGRSNYGPIKSVTGTVSTMCGCFRDARRSENGDNYKGYKALVLSQMPNRDLTASLTIDTSVAQITFTHNNTTQTVTLSNDLSTAVGSISIAFNGAQLTLGIPSGEAVLMEF